MKINARDWLNPEERQIWDACSTEGIDVNVRVSVDGKLRRGEMGTPTPEFKAASDAIELVKAVLGRGPVRMLLTRISRYRSHFLDRHLKFIEARDKLWELRHTLHAIALSTGDDEISEKVDDLDKFLSHLSSEWKAGATFEEGQASGSVEPDDE